MRIAHLITYVSLVAATVLSGCRSAGQVAQDGTNKTSSTERVAEMNVPSGTSFDVTLATPLTSETATVGTAWSGSMRNAAVVDGRSLIPAGSSVTGTVTSVKPARTGDRAMLDLGLTSVTIDGRTYDVHGTTESIIAGSPRARNLGAIAGGAAAGALIGKAASGSTKGTIIGAVVGGGVATGAVAKSKGWQVVLKEGTELMFTTNESVAVRI